MGKVKQKGLSGSQMYGVALTLITVGISIAMGIYVNQQTATTLDTGTAQNHSITFANATWYPLPYRAASITEVVNYTNTTSQFIADTAGAGAGWDTRTTGGTTTQVILYTNGSYIAGAFNVSYLAYDSDAYLAQANATEGIQTMAEWLPVISVVLAAAIVLAVLVGYFKGGGI